MAGTRISVPRRIGQIITGLAGLLLLVGLLAGAPVALWAVAGNPIPTHLPTLEQAATTLTSPDDGQLFLRALALVGWLGWLTFAISVLVELVAAVLRVPAPHLPGMRTQQRMATALIASVTLIVSTGAAASASALGLGGGPAPVAQEMTPAYAGSASTVIPHGAPADTPLQVGYQSLAPAHTEGWGAAPGRIAPAVEGFGSAPAGTTIPAAVPSASSTAAPAPAQSAPVRPGPGAVPQQPGSWAEGPWGAAPGPMRALSGGQGAGYQAPAQQAEAGDPVYRVEKDDYLGSIADRYLGDFDKYPELAELNGIKDPDLIRVGDFLHLPEDAEDHGVRDHATGLVDAPPPESAPVPAEPEPEGAAAPGTPAPAPSTQAPSPDPSKAPAAPTTQAPAPATQAPSGQPPATQAPISAAPPAEGGQDGEDPLGGLNGARGLDGSDRGPLPLAVSAVLAAAAVVGAQVGALLGLRDRRRPTSRR